MPSSYVGSGGGGAATGVGGAAGVAGLGEGVAEAPKKLIGLEADGFWKLFKGGVLGATEGVLPPKTSGEGYPDSLLVPGVLGNA